MEGTIIGLAHIGLFCTDLERTQRFYHDVLTFDTEFAYLSDDGHRVAFLRCGDLCIEAIEVKDAARENGWVDHIALRVQHIEEVEARLRALGVRFETGEIYHCKTCYPGGSKWILFSGPDGERLEIMERLA